MKIEKNWRKLKNRGGVLIYLNKTSPPDFPGCKLHPPGVGIEAIDEIR